MVLILQKYWKQIAAILAVCLALFMLYDKVYTSGYTAASVEYQKKIDEYNSRILEKVAEVQGTSAALAESLKLSDDTRSAEFSKLLDAAKKKPLVISTNTGCILSNDYVNTVNSATKQINKK